MIFCAYAAPIPGSVSSSSLVAALMSILPPALCEAPAAPVLVSAVLLFFALLDVDALVDVDGVLLFFVFLCACAATDITSTSARQSVANCEYMRDRFISAPFVNP